MGQWQPKVTQFLQKTGMHPAGIALEEGCERFVAEMRRGLSGEPSSLQMLPTYLQVDSPVPHGERVIVMDAGGTNFRVATVTFAQEGPVIEGFQKHPMPGTQGPLGRDAFFRAIAERMLPVLDGSEKVGFCYSYQAEIQPDRDAKLLPLNKEVQVEGVTGELIGVGVNEALASLGARPKRFVLLNDTTATMLGGLASAQDRVFDGQIGYILGTGTNTCYLEDCEKIRKVPALAAWGGQMGINMESGGYNLFPQGEVDRALDAASSCPGRMQMEKMISGRYLASVVHGTVQSACAEDLFSPSFEEEMEKIPDFTMIEVNEFCRRPHGDGRLAALCTGSGDARTLFELIDAVFERAARMTAVNLAAILVQTGAGKDPTRPACITAEGTTFYHTEHFRQKLDHYVRSFLNDTLGHYCAFVRCENATLIGTAVAALLH